MSKHAPPNYDMTFCVSDWCEARHDCARHVSHYEFDDRPVSMADLTNLKEECEHHIPMEAEIGTSGIQPGKKQPS